MIVSGRPIESKKHNETRNVAGFFVGDGLREAQGGSAANICVWRVCPEPCCATLAACLQCAWRPALADVGVGFGLQTAERERGMLDPTGAARGVST